MITNDNIDAFYINRSKVLLKNPTEYVLRIMNSCDVEENSTLCNKLNSSPFTKDSDNVIENNVHLNSYNVNDITSSRTNKTYIINTSSNPTLSSLVPLAESTLIEKLTTKCTTDTNNIESDNSVVSKHNMDDSFHLSDYSLSENTSENENDENDENATNINVNETVRSTLNLTTSLCTSKKNICDDKDMYVETSQGSKLKSSMCPYCKRLQKQFARHLESVHKTEEDVKKFRFLPKGK